MMTTASISRFLGIIHSSDVKSAVSFLVRVCVKIKKSGFGRNPFDEMH